MKISVVIPVYKNKQLFLDNLIHNLPLLKDSEIIVVDDASSENLDEEIGKKFKNVKILTNSQNLGFAASVNKGVGAAKGELILLLNSDVKLLKIDLMDLINQFKKDPDIFALSFLQKEKNGESVGKNIIYFDRGLVFHKRADNLEAGPTAWAEGGSCIFQRKIFNDLRGFDEIYAPFYWEDIDLSYRAVKAGYKVLFYPGAVVEHYHESTIGKYFRKDQIQKIAYRNQFIFIWKNITDLKFLLSHFIYLPLNIIYLSFKGGKNFILGFIEAFFKLGLIFKKRNNQK